MKQIQIQPCGDPVAYLNQVKYVIEGRIIMKYLPVFSSIHLVSLFIHLSIREQPLLSINQRSSFSVGYQNRVNKQSSHAPVQLPPVQLPQIAVLRIRHAIGECTVIGWANAENRAKKAAKVPQ